MNATSPTQGKFRRFMRLTLRLGLWSFLIGIMLLAGLAAGTSWVVHDASKRLPSYEEIKARPTGTTVRYFSVDGDLLHSQGPQYGEWLEYVDTPVTMRKAMVAIEDRRYREHKGVDPIALARAAKFAWDNYGTGRRLQGASTITQQVARTLFLDRRYDVRRKLDEMIVALALERKFSKEQILELYLNRVYFGGGAYGVDAASRTFFGHDATNLSLEEAALLAGLVKAPSDYAPTADPKAAEGRMRVVLGVIKSTGQDRSADTAAPMPKLDLQKEREDRTGSRHFIDWIAPQVEQIRPELVGKIDIHTTLDDKLQTLAQDSVEGGAPSGTQPALVTIDDSGAVRAMVGGLDYATSSYNRATQAKRQPGSSFKLFVYLTALESGYGPNSRVFDGPITIGDWSPQNNSGRYSGNMRMQSAFAFSLNTVAARLGQKLTTERISQMAQRLGISTPVTTSPSMVLGTSEVRLIDMTRAYATVAAQGKGVVPYGVERIEQSGRVIYRHEPSQAPRLLSESVAANMTYMMRGSVESGTSRAADIGRAVAGKTGTTNSNKDGWFIGFSSGLTTGVWVGRDDAKPVPGLQGGRAPARIFANYMKDAVEGRPQGFETITPPRIAAPDLQMTAGERLQVSTPSNEPAKPLVTEDAGPPVARQAPPPQAAPPVSREGRSRAIRPDD